MSSSSEALWDLALSKCCQEPVHTPGTIQSFGSLVVTDLALETITHVSANVPQMLELETLESTSEPLLESTCEQSVEWDGTGVLGKPLNTVFSDELIQKLSKACEVPWIGVQRERMGIHKINGKLFNICIQVQGDRTLIELEPALPQVTEEKSLVTRLKFSLQSDQEHQDVLSHCANEFRHVTGFDRIMVYRFLHDGAGEVIAESRVDDIESFLHLKFPATDIPDSSRQIFRKIALRPIPDLSAPLVPLLAWDKTEAPLDLSLISSRGASKVHTQEYLPNMGIASSMALAITVEDELWGLFAFHHRQPKLLSPQLRATLELCGLLISLYLQQKLTKVAFQHQQAAAKLLTQTFGQHIRTDNDWQTLVIQTLDQLCHFISADGLALVSDRRILSTYGEVPDDSAILNLLESTQSGDEEEMFLIDSLSQLAQSGKITEEDWGASAGVLILPIDFNGFNYLAFFRNEMISEVLWAGNPDGQKVVEEESLTGVNMRPQRSFEAYKQLVVGRCRPWSPEDRALVKELRYALETQVFLQERQGLLIAELKHRVKNILALIRSVVRQTSRSTHSLDQYIQILEKRIAALAMAHEFVARRELSWPNLQDLLELELRPYLGNDGTCDTSVPRVTLTGPYVALNASFVPTLILVLHEMISNAVKYGALSVPEGRLVIQWFKDRNGLTLLWRESNGPTVCSPDTDKRGFGSELIERAIVYEFDGEASLCFAPSGVEINFWLPQKLLRWEARNASLSATTEVDSSKLKSAASTSPQTRSAIDKGSVLLIEDNMLIAIELENLLKTMGFSTIDSAPTVDRAMKLLRHKSSGYQVCLLDINLKTETSFAIAYHLSKTQTPLAFISGYDSKHPIPDDLKHIPLLKKPIDTSKLTSMLQTLLNNAEVSAHNEQV